MKIKLFVNNPELWDSFLEELDKRIDAVNKRMAQVEEPKDLYRCQGELKALQRLKNLRDQVNNG